MYHMKHRVAMPSHAKAAPRKPSDRRRQPRGRRGGAAHVLQHRQRMGRWPRNPDGPPGVALALDLQPLEGKRRRGAGARHHRAPLVHLRHLQGAAGAPAGRREDRICGPGASPIMAAFTHRNPDGSRFSDGSFGVYYAAHALETAVWETAHHRARFLRATKQTATQIDMRCYLASIDAELTDIRGQQKRRRDLYDPASYAASRPYGVKLRAQGAGGIVYDSVRHPGGECIAVFKPRLLRRAVQGAHLCFVWDGERIARWYEKSELRKME